MNCLCANTSRKCCVWAHCSLSMTTTPTLTSGPDLFFTSFYFVYLKPPTSPFLFLCSVHSARLKRAYGAHTHTGNRHNKQPFYFSSWLFPFLLGAFPSWAVFVCSLPLLTRTTTGRKSAVTHRKPSPPLLLLPFHFSAISLSDSHIHTSFSSPILWGLPVCSSLQCTYSSVSSSPLLFLSFCVCLSSASFEIMWSLWRN